GPGRPRGLRSLRSNAGRRARGVLTLRADEPAPAAGRGIAAIVPVSAVRGRSARGGKAVGGGRRRNVRNENDGESQQRGDKPGPLGRPATRPHGSLRELAHIRTAVLAVHTRRARGPELSPPETAHPTRNLTTDSGRNESQLRQSATP